MSEEPMSKDEEKCMKLIYNGGYIPDLAIDVDPHHDMRGWLFYRHPYGQWEPLVYVEEQYDAIKQENAELRQQLAFAKAFADPPDIKTGQTVRDELKAENERTNAKIAKYQALVRYWIPCTAERKIAEIEST